MERKQGAHANFTPCKMLVPKRSKLRGRWARGGERDAHTARTKSDRTGIDYDRADPDPEPSARADWHCRRSAHSPQKRRGLRSHPLQLQRSGEGPTRGAKVP